MKKRAKRTENVGRISRKRKPRTAAMSRKQTIRRVKELLLAPVYFTKGFIEGVFS